MCLEKVYMCLLLVCVLHDGVLCNRFRLTTDRTCFAMLCKDGTYSAHATLGARLRLFSLPYTEMTSRHLWNYLALLMAAIDTMNQSSSQVVQWRKTLFHIIGRVEGLQVEKHMYIDPIVNHDIDEFMVSRVKQHLKKLLRTNPTTTTTSRIVTSFDYHDTLHMYKSLFSTWDAPRSIIQLIVRSYMPAIYILHSVHDHADVCTYDFYHLFYTPLHHAIVDVPIFLTEIGSRQDYEVALTYVDSGIWEDMS